MMEEQVSLRQSHSATRIANDTNVKPQEASQTMEELEKSTIIGSGAINSAPVISERTLDGSMAS